LQCATAGGGRAIGTGALGAHRRQPLQRSPADDGSCAAWRRTRAQAPHAAGVRCVMRLLSRPQACYAVRLQPLSFSTWRTAYL